MGNGKSGSYWVVNINITAVKYSREGSKFVTIPRGAVILIREEPKAIHGLIEIEYRGETLQVYSRDILERAERKM